jgi:putative membrane protein
MTNQREAEFSLQTAVASDANTRFSFERTMLSHERTQMAWVRTATSLITFGFTIYKFFQFEVGESVRPQTHQIIGPREYAMFMIAIGLIALLIATIQNYQYRQNLRKQHFRIPISLSSVVGALITILGLLSMLAAIFRW